MLMAKSLREVAEHLQVHLVGDPAIEVTSVASIRSASASDLVFVESEKHLEEAIASKAAALIVGKFALHGCYPKSLLISDQPKLSFARASRFLRESESARIWRCWLGRSPSQRQDRSGRYR